MKKVLLGACSVFAFAMTAHAEEAATVASADTADSNLEEIIVSARKTTYANNATDQVMLEATPDASSVLATVDKLPGIFISEGGTFGSDDWSTTISIRGFNVGLSEQQIGMTIDGLPNGNSNYGGGAKANRYLDNENMERAEVSQGTADISSPSHEALGGTINFISNDPTENQRFWAGISAGQNNAQRYFMRYDTGEIFANTRAYFSYSHQNNDAWIGTAGGTKRDHAAFKIVSEQDQWKFTGRLSWDDAWENNYQRISLDQFKKDPNWDRLTDTITGIPYVDQVYRPGWGTLRTNWFAYVKAEYKGDNLDVTVAPYYHDNWGRGDWTPPYLVQVAGGTQQADGAIYGGSAVGSYTYTDPSGNPIAPIDGCTATLSFPYGGGSPANNPACYPAGSLPVGSYRHTNYGKTRIGVTADAAYHLSDTNTLRAGLWWENSDRHEYRTWHKEIDPTVGIEFEYTEYWRQYDRNFKTNTLMMYAEDTAEFGKLQVRGGVKKFLVDLTRVDNFGNDANQGLKSNSKLLFTAGAIYSATDNMDVFAGFSQNFAAIKDTVIEGRASVTNPNIPDLQGETADNYDFGVRFSNAAVKATVTGYYIKFNNRITFVSAGDGTTGVDYLEVGQGTYLNVGGIESKGVEASLSADFANYFNFYSSLTVNSSKYTETTAQVVAGNKVALSPEFQFVGTLSYHKDGVRAGLSGKHVGKRWGDFANTQRLPSFTTFDLWLGYTVAQNAIPGIDTIDLSLNVTNLTDKRYLGGGTPGSYFIGAGREAIASLTFKF
ncbi:TonB-dependent receptor domain-containing protein [Kordiimonas marina]|uniref:TonB-dependent receptor domain-containing protein n=1 Tax=Kordiimonas marina TaxID=2872312 RepID=UPI001FF58D2A|nr:TonB-dependent receptor [Kordiimonas marina]MCJ9428614.1 TonB-dependent receptor [Kordiimonas marina]